MRKLLTDVLHTLLKAGGQGAYVDNIHAGGGLIGVGTDGRLNAYVCDQLGRRSAQVNGQMCIRDSP